jgi:NDP-sugar pyrophosphorylase family protein
MHNFLPSQFFDLTQVNFAELFQTTEPVWKVLEHINSYLSTLSLGKIEGHIETGAFLVDPENISIGEGTVVESGAYIKGPCLIGKRCHIRHGAYIRGSLITGDDCVIGHATEVKNSIFLKKAQAGHFSYVGDSILGSFINLGAGTKCANLRFDNQLIKIFDGHGWISTGLRKLGLILGDEGQTGCNSVTNPGTIMGKKSICFPCVNVGGIIAEGERVTTSVYAL